MEYVTLVAGILEEILNIAGTATTGQAQSIISMLDRMIAMAASLAPNLIVSIQNIIAALSGNGAVTADQVAQLQAQSVALDAALDAAAAKDGLSV